MNTTDTASRAWLVYDLLVHREALQALLPLLCGHPARPQAKKALSLARRLRRALGRLARLAGAAGQEGGDDA